MPQKIKIGILSDSYLKTHLHDEAVRHLVEEVTYYFRDPRSEDWDQRKIVL